MILLLIAIVLGALVGAAAGGEAGALAGALFGWLILRSLRQQREIEDLRKRADVPVLATARRDARADLAPTEQDAEGAMASPATPGAAVDMDATRAVTPMASAPSAAAAIPVAATATGRTVADASPSPVQPPTAVALPPAAAAPPRDLLAPIRRWLFGGNTIVKAGIGILFVGLAFLAKYASEHVHLPIEVRLAAIGAAGVVLLGFGWRLRLSRPGLRAGAAGRRGRRALPDAVRRVPLLQRAIGAMPAFVMMVAGRRARRRAGGAAGRARARRHRCARRLRDAAASSRPAADNYVALFSYYFVLDLGIAAVAWSKTWRPLNLIGFVATFIVATAWGVLKYRPEDYATSQAFLIAFFLLFVVILVLPARRLAPRRRREASLRRTATPGSTAACCSACRRSPSRSSTAWSATCRTAPRWRRWCSPAST